MKNYPLRVIAISPTYRGFAYAVLDGTEKLFDWGLAHFLRRTDENILARVGKLLDRSAPGILVLEDGRGTRRRERAQRLMLGMEAVARERNITVVRISRSTLKRTLAPASTKQEIAKELSILFPVLARSLPRVRKPWAAEDERMSIFDAVSFALVALLR